MASAWQSTRQGAEGARLARAKALSSRFMGPGRNCGRSGAPECQGGRGQGAGLAPGGTGDLGLILKRWNTSEGLQAGSDVILFASFKMLPLCVERAQRCGRWGHGGAILRSGYTGLSLGRLALQPPSQEAARCPAGGTARLEFVFLLEESSPFPPQRPRHERPAPSEP